MTSVVQREDLECKAGSKDAVYHIQIREAGGGLYLVNYQNGRAGGTLATGSLTPEPVSLEAATKVFRKKVDSKLKASPPYKPMNAEGSSFTEVASDVQQRATGLVPQLQNEIDHEDHAAIEALICDPRYIAEHKHDGQRRGAKAVVGGVVLGSNRKGQEVALPVGIASSLRNASCAVDGEIIGDTLYVFDLYEHDGANMRSLALRERRARLEGMSGSFGGAVRVVQAAYTTEAKRALIRRTKEMGQEGVVFKDLSAPHSEGRPNSGGPQLKLKHWKKAAVLVARHNQDRRSVVCGVVAGDDTVVEVGSVTVAESRVMPPAGSVILVRYLYAFDGGSMFEPTFERVLGGERRGEALLSNLHFKQPHVEIDVRDLVEVE